MKSFIWIYLIILFFSDIYAQKNVVTYYKEMPDSLVYGYPLNFDGKKWRSTSYVDYPIFPIVDTKNGYIEITDEGTGGGITKIQTVLFLTSDKQPVIGVSYLFNDGFDIETHINFYEPKNNKWNNITKAVLPQISFKNFCSENYKAPKYINDFYSIEYILPRYGTTIIVKLWENKAQMYCNRLFTDIDEHKIQEACNFLKNIKKKEIQLSWKRTDRKFIIN